MQQLLLFNAPQTPGFAGSPASGAAPNAAGRIGSGPEGFADTMRSVLKPLASHQTVGTSDADGAPVLSAQDLSQIIAGTVSGQQAAALTVFDGEGLPVLPNNLTLNQVPGLNGELTSADQSLLGESLMAEVSVGLESDALLSGVTTGLVPGTDNSSAIVADLAGVVPGTGNISLSMDSAITQMLNGEGTVPAGVENTESIDPKMVAASGPSLAPGLVAPTPMLSASSAVNVAPVMTAQPVGQDRMTVRSDSSGAMRAKSQAAISLQSAGLNGAGLTPGGQSPDAQMMAGASSAAAASDAAGEPQRLLSSSWNNLFQGGGLQSQPSAKTDVNFKMSMEQALAGVEAGGDVPDELLAKLAEPNSPRPSELGAKVSSATADKPYSSSVNVPVGDPEWGAKMNEKVMWLSGRGIQSAQIHLNPVELGPVEVKVSVQNDQTVISFNVQNTGVKELLESNVQRLRDMIDQNGGTLAEVNVEERSSDREGLAQQQQNSQKGGGSSSGSHGDGDLVEDGLSLDGETGIDSMSLVDDYA